jgi:hypothetical protein
MSRQTILALTLLGLTGCGRQEVAKPPPAMIPPVAKAEVPLDAPYEITSDGDENSVRRVVEVKLKKKVTPEVLREIALELKAKEERPHERTIISYYIPVEFHEVAGQPWASIYFKPNLELKILGFSLEEEAMMRGLPLDHKGKRIGAWLQDNQYKTLDLIYDDAGTIKIAEIRSPTDRADSVMIEVPVPTGRRFRKMQGSNFYDVDMSGNLRISNDRDQVISAAKPMK